MPGLSQIAGIVEPLRSYNYEVILPREFGDSARLRYQVRNVEFPVWWNLKVEEVRRQNLGKWYLPVDFEKGTDISIEFWESEDLAVQSYFNSWRDKIVSEQVIGEINRELVSVPREWMKDVEVILLNASGSEVKRYQLVNCYPAEMAVGRLDYGGSELVLVTVTLITHGVR